MTVRIDRQLADEVARRAARRLEILRAERPDLLTQRLAALEPERLSELLELTRLPASLADREPCHSHVGIAGVDHCTNRLLLAGAGRRPKALAPAKALRLAELDDDDLLAAGRFVPETLPGNVLG